MAIGAYGWLLVPMDVNGWLLVPMDANGWILVPMMLMDDYWCL